MEYCVRRLFICVNVDANVSSSVSQTVTRMGDGVLSNPVQVVTHAPGQRRVCCSGQDAQKKDGASGGGELEMDVGVRER